MATQMIVLLSAILEQSIQHMEIMLRGHQVRRATPSQILLKYTISNEK
jgi:hypothetical protein